MKSIRAVFCDNEGCVVPGKGLAFPLDHLSRLRTFIGEHGNVGFGICSGRSVPYLEAMVQALGLNASSTPCIGEGGAALYWPAEDRFELLTGVVDRGRLASLLDGLSFREELGKHSCFSVYPERRTTVDDLYAAIARPKVLGQYHVTRSVAAVDVTPRGVDKAFGVREACRRMDISTSEVLCIGDSDNDVPMLEAARFSACPANANDVVKAVVDYVANSESTVGVLEILHHFEADFG